MKRIFSAALITLCTVSIFAAGYAPTDAERARWTMGDMESWRMVFAAYKTDHGVYPPAHSMAELKALVQPIYINVAPTTDGWGNEYRYSVDPQTGDYLLVSAGADGVFQPPSELKAGKVSSFNDDAAATGTARFLFRSWEYK